jgi:F-type H+-transporting ATPase subunit b
MKYISALLLTVVASPAFAASGPFFSLYNTNFVVMVAFIGFVALVLYLGVPKMLGQDAWTTARMVFAQNWKKRVRCAKRRRLCWRLMRKSKLKSKRKPTGLWRPRESRPLQRLSRPRLTSKNSVARRMVAAEEQIASAEAAAIKDVRDEAIIVAVAAARDIIENQMTAADGNGLIDDAIEQVGSKLH